MIMKRHDEVYIAYMKICLYELYKGDHKAFFKDFIESPYSLGSMVNKLKNGNK